MLRRSTQESRAPNRYVSSLDYVMLTDCKEPSCYNKAMLHDDKLKWERAMQSKMDLLHKNATWDLVQVPSGKRALPCKWVQKLKVTDSESKPKYKARLVAKGFRQQQGIDFEEIFSPIVKMTTLRCVLALVIRMDQVLVQIDDKTMFLHDDLHKEIYIQQKKVLREKAKIICV